MGTRLELQKKLEELFGSANVYYQPPESIKMKYPAIRYSKSKIDTTKADNTTYLMRNKYDITVIDRMPDNPIIKKLMELQYCSYDRNYISDGLNHDVLTLYY